MLLLKLPTDELFMRRLITRIFPLWSLGLFLVSLSAEANSIQYARNFTVEAYETHRVLSVKSIFKNGEAVQRYALVPRESPLPELADDLLVVRTPVQRVVVMETVYIGYIDALDQLSKIVGAATVDFISQPEVRAAVAAGEIEAVQFGQRVDIERLMLLQPDLILTSISGDPAFDVPPRLLRSGLPVVITAGYTEAHPLGRAEWLKFIAAFFDASTQAEAVFAERAERYEFLRRKSKNVPSRPKVFSGAPYSGVWHVAGGQSYTARAIQDAGGDYIWANHPSQGAIPLDTERVFLRAAEADFWLHPSHYRTLSELLSADARFAHFQAVRSKQVFNNSRQISPRGGNNIWERGVVYPDEVLADLICILHPQQLPDHELIYYERLP